MAHAAPAAPRYVHLHVHSEYSLLDGACRIRDLVTACRRLDMPAVALTDHGNLFGAIEFYTAAAEAGVKPIIGCEVYMAPGDRRTKEARGLREAAYHLLLLAMNREGYRNLVKLASIAYLEGFYYRPRIDKQVLAEHAGGLICTSTCLGGEVPQALLKRDLQTARRVAEEYLSIFGADRFFIELQNHGMPEQAQTNPELCGLARRLGVGMIASNDVHYLTADDVEAHEVLCCIATRARLRDEDHFRLPTDQFYLKSPQEMAAALPEYHDALENTVRVAEMCNVEFDFTKRFAPRFAPPPGRSADEYLRELAYAGAAERYAVITDEIRERLDYELSVVADKGFSSYFLIVWDVARFCRASDIPALARGSGCSTVIGYCLRISGADPLRYGLYFERFMDPERDEMPDIDIDICQDRRAEVIDYVRGKYGHVAQIITFGRLKARAAIRDICRVMDLPLSQADRIAKLVPEELKMTIDRALDREPELRQLCDQDPALRKVIDIGRRLEGLARHASVHAAGVVIADQPLDEIVPLHKPADSPDVTTQFEGPMVEKIGLLKMDFLGLKTLSQLHRTCQLVQRHHGVTIDLEKLDLSDQRVYELFARGETRGLFQFESGGMRDVLLKMKPNRIEDLIAANALFRPGPMAYIDEYCARKHGKPWETPHAIMTDVLRETYGIMVYQEQVSRLVNRLGDVPLRRAFRLAKAISKKKESMINAEREPFLEGAIRNGLSREAAEGIFADILKFGGYAFNKAHSTGYALIAFQTACLKTYYPVEFMASLLTYESGDTSRMAEYLDEARRMRNADGSVGIPVRPPDVNHSEEDFTVVYAEPRCDGAGHAGSADSATGLPARCGEIRFGLAAISGVGHKATQAILAARAAGGRFRDLFDFCERVDLTTVNKAVLEALIKSGAFDDTGAVRKALMDVLERAIELGQERQRDRCSGQLDMFGAFGGGAAAPPPAISTAEWSDAEMLAYEKATLGFYITKHPLTRYADLVEAFGTSNTALLRGLPDGTRVILGGLISRIRSVPIKTGRSAGKKLLIAVLEDFVGMIEAIIFPDQLPDAQPLLKPDTILFIDGSVDRRREEPSIRVSQLIPVAEARRRLSRQLVLHLHSGRVPADVLPDLQALIAAHRGPCPLFVEIESGDGLCVTFKLRGGGVDPSDEFLARMEWLVGQRSICCNGPRGAVQVRAPLAATRSVAAAVTN
jgi:DNA polymerase-3 subunit alpha